MKRLIIDVKPGFIGWDVEWRDMGRARRAFRSKQTAINHGRYEASTHKAYGGLAQLVIHGRNGRIQSERTYGQDPKRRKG